MTSRKRSTWKVKQFELRSKFEYTVAVALVEAGVEFGYEERSYPWWEKLPRAVCKSCGEKDCQVARSYTPDFFLPNGNIIEAKGRFTSKDRKIAAAMREIIGSNFKMLFMTNNWLNKNKKSRYGDWCDARDIEWAVGPKVPKEWLR